MLAPIYYRVWKAHSWGVQFSRVIISQLRIHWSDSVWLISLSALPKTSLQCAPMALLCFARTPWLAHIASHWNDDLQCVSCNSCGLYKSKNTRVYLHLEVLCAFTCASLYLGRCVCIVFIRMRQFLTMPVHFSLAMTATGGHFLKHVFVSLALGAPSLCFGEIWVPIKCIVGFLLC